MKLAGKCSESTTFILQANIWFKRCDCGGREGGRRFGALTLFLDIFLSPTAEMYSAQFECLIAAAHVAVSLERLT